MPFNGSGVYSPPPPPTFPAVSDELIRAIDYNTMISDIADALTNCITKDNQSTVPMLTLGALQVTGTAALGSSSTVAGEQILTRRYTTGEVIMTIASTAPPGTLYMNGQTIGSASSGGTARANADTQALFELLWNTANNTLLPIQDATGAATTRGISAAADFSANKRMPLPSIVDGETLLLSAGSQVLSHTPGQILTHTHTSSLSTDGAHTHAVASNSGEGDDPNTFTNGWGRNGSVTTDSAGSHTHTVTINSTGGVRNLAAGIFLKGYIAL